MRNLSDRPTLRTLLLAWVLSLGVGMAGAGLHAPLRAQAPAPAPAPAQTPAEVAAPAAAPPSPTVADTPERAALRQEIEAVYDVRPSPRGVRLESRAPYRGVQSIEVRDDALIVNGEDLTERAARDWLGERADALLRLRELDGGELRRLFALPEAGIEDGIRAAEEGALAAEEAARDAEEQAAAIAAGAPLPPRPPRPPRVRRGVHTGFGSSVHIREDEVTDDVVVFGGSITVDGRVEGDVTAMGGEVRINGEVTRDAVSIGNDVVLGPNSRVGGDVTAVGGEVIRSSGASVGGTIEEVENQGWNQWLPGGVMPWVWDGGNSWRPDWSPWHGIWELAWPIAELLLLCILAAIVLTLGRRMTENVGARARLSPIKAGVVGLLVAVLTFPVLIIVCVFLAISIIGIPILIIFVLLFVLLGLPALFVFAVIGYTAVALEIGRWAERRFGWNAGSVYAAAFVGLLGLHVLELIGAGLGIFGGPVHVFSAMFLTAACILQFLAVIIGFGAICVHVWERRGRKGAAAVPPPAPHGEIPAPPPPAPQPPPAPPAPPAPEPPPLTEEPIWEEPDDEPPPGR